MYRDDQGEPRDETQAANWFRKGAERGNAYAQNNLGSMYYISNHRLVSDEDGRVCSRWNDYRHENKQKVMTLEADEFIRRFLIHTLPPRFQRIRHFGFMANCHRKDKLDLCGKLLIAPIADLLPQPEQCRQMRESLTETPVRRCPECGIGTMIRIEVLPHYRWPESPPDTS